MRFLMLATFYPPWSFGGDGQMVQMLAHALVERGAEVTVAHSVASHRVLEGSKSPPQEELWREERGVRLVGIDHDLGPLAPVASYVSGRPSLTRRRIEKLFDAGFDVVHFHNPSLLGAPGVFRLRADASLKLLTLHDYWLVCPTSVFTRNQKELCTRRTCIRCLAAHHRPPQPWRYTPLLRRSIGGLDAMLAPSQTSARLHAGLPGEVPVRRLENFVDPDPGEAEGSAPQPGVARPHPRADTAPHPRARFLFVGRLERMKGAERLLPVFAQRPRDELVIVGKGSQEPRLRKLAAGLPNVHLTGKLAPHQLEPLYRQATAVLMPTIGHESCPLVLLEAHARGIPVIASDHGALREMIRSSGGGLLFADAGELHQALDRISSEAGLRSALGSRARAHYLREWTREAHLQRYFGLIEELARRRGDDRLAAAARAAA